MFFSLAFLRLNEAEAVAETCCGKTPALFFCRWARQLNDTSCLAPFFPELKKFLPTTSLTGYC